MTPWIICKTRCCDRAIGTMEDAGGKFLSDNVVDTIIILLNKRKLLTIEIEVVLPI